MISIGALYSRNIDHSFIALSLHNHFTHSCPLPLPRKMTNETPKSTTSTYVGLLRTPIIRYPILACDSDHAGFLGHVPHTHTSYVPVCVVPP